VTAPRRLVFSPRAATDLDELTEYIGRDNPARAASFVAELQISRAADKMYGDCRRSDDLSRPVTTSRPVYEWLCMGGIWCYFAI